MKSFRSRKFGRIVQNRLTCNLGTVIDISGGGMSVQCGRAPQGEVDIEFTGHVLPHPLRGNIVWCRRAGLFKHDVGLQFIDASPEMVRCLCAMASANRLRLAA